MFKLIPLVRLIPLAIPSIFFSAHSNADVLGLLKANHSHYAYAEKSLAKNNILVSFQSHPNELTVLNNPVDIDTDADIDTDIKEKIMQEYQDWKGVRYHFGGNSRRGIDCSAFVQRIFRKQFDFNLPRTSRAQIAQGNDVTRAELRSGDIIMFHTNAIDRHVGIYLGNDEFVHVSKNKGVIISKLSNSYWNKHFNSARRLLGA